MDRYNFFDVRTTRQDTIPVQRETKSIFLVGGKHNNQTDGRSLSNILEVEKTSFFEEFSPIADLVYSITPEEDTSRILLVLLEPFKQVYKHIDHGNYYLNNYRYHINLSGFTFSSEDGIIIKPGELWELNNDSPHSTFNPYPIPRIALVWDAKCRI